MNIQLLTFDGCPLAEPARENLQKALASCGIDTYEEIDILAAGSPEELRGWGSPTILVEGKDLTGHNKGDSVCCRVYDSGTGVPDVQTIIEVIQRASV